MLNAEVGEPVIADTRTRIEQSALQLFRSRGFVGASIREIAGGADIAIATMFHHFPTKSAILEGLLHRIVDTQQIELDHALSGLDEPTDRLRAFVTVIVVSHCLRSDESFVAETELRSLDEAIQAPIRDKRRKIQHVLRQIIEDGVTSGEYSVADPTTAGIAILTMCTSVASWYREGRGLGPAALAHEYADYALAILSRRA